MAEKVFAYITHGDNLLIFSHPDFPEAGLQVPAGTIEPGEDPHSAVLRETFEETGLINLTLKGFLGKCQYDMSSWGGARSQVRYFFHFEAEGDVPIKWRHAETSGGKVAPIVFEFFWARLPDGVPELIAGHDQMLPALIERRYQSL